MKKQRSRILCFLICISALSVQAGPQASASSCKGVDKQIKLIEKALRGGETTVDKRKLKEDLNTLKQLKSSCTRKGLKTGG